MSVSYFPRRIVLHADDFGLNSPVSQGIVAGFESGLLTSTAILANAPAAGEALDAWRWLVETHRAGRLTSMANRRRLDDEGGDFDLGVHLNLTQGQPLIGRHFPRPLLDAEGNFLSPGKLFTRLYSQTKVHRRAIQAELSAQVEFLLARGVVPTHLNGHQYVELMPLVCELIPELAAEYSIAVVRLPREPRHGRNSLRPGFRPRNWLLSQAKQFFARGFAARMEAAGLRHPQAYFGASHAGRIDLKMCERFLNAAVAPGVIEIAFHPGYIAPDPLGDGPLEGKSGPWSDPLALLRPAELALLQSAGLVEFLALRGVRLSRLGSLAAGRSAAA